MTPPDNAVLRQVNGVSLALPVGFVTRGDHAMTPVQQELMAKLRAQLKRNGQG